jgi:hypothetical protein
VIMILINSGGHKKIRHRDSDRDQI